MSGTDVSLPHIRSAHQRILPLVRRTPLLHLNVIKNAVPCNPQLYLKLETQQITGSFKVRGACSKLTTLGDAALARGLITASGGNHGSAVAYAGWIKNIPTCIYLPTSTSLDRIKRIESYGGSIVLYGDVWDDANVEAMRQATAQGMTYIHPYGDPDVINGQGTIALEMVSQVDALDYVIVAIGGGGLIGGIATAIKELSPRTQVIGVEAAGASSMLESLRAGHPVMLDHINTKAGTIALKTTTQLNYDLVKRYVDDIVLVSDDEMTAASRWLWRECALGTELSGAAAMAVLLFEKIHIPDNARVGIIVCGAGTDWLP